MRQPGTGRFGARFFIASEVLVVRPRTAFRRDPGDDFVRVLDVARLAVHAVRGVDLQALAGVRGAVGIVDDLVHARRAETRARIVVFGRAARDAYRRIVHDEVHRLVFVVFGRGEIHAGQAI